MRHNGCKDCRFCTIGARILHMRCKDFAQDNSVCNSVLCCCPTKSENPIPNTVIDIDKFDDFIFSPATINSSTHTSLGIQVPFVLLEEYMYNSKV